MSVGFGGVPFAVMTDDSSLPAVTRGDDRAVTYSAQIRVDGNTNWANLEALLVDASVRPAIGRPGYGTIVVEGYGSFGNLTIPANNGAEQVWRACLVSLQGTAANFANVWRASATWLVGDRIS